MKKPIAVILPVYNGMPYLIKSVNSVLEQSLPDFDLHILDDRSTDGSWEWLSGLGDPRIKLSRNPVNKGLFPNLNLLAASTDAPLIKLWSQDDILEPEYLRKTVEFHGLHPEIGFSYTGADRIDEHDRPLPSPDVDNTPAIVSTELHARIAFFTGSIAGNIANVTLSRAAFERVGPFREDMRISGDFDMWVRLAQHHPVGFIRERLIRLRSHSGQLSRQEKYYIFHLKEDIQVYKYLLGYVPPESYKEGRRLLRNYKLMFYYTVMISAFLKGRWSTALTLFKDMSTFDNMLMLSWTFFQQRILKRNVFTSTYNDNSALLEGRL
jgi:glycosyltransferase involved in cell wall biosynthesis